MKPIEFKNFIGIVGRMVSYGYKVKIQGAEVTSWTDKAIVTETHDKLLYRIEALTYGNMKTLAADTTIELSLDRMLELIDN